MGDMQDGVRQSLGPSREPLQHRGCQERDGVAEVVIGVVVASWRAWPDSRYVNTMRFEKDDIAEMDEKGA